MSVREISESIARACAGEAEVRKCTGEIPLRLDSASVADPITATNAGAHKAVTSAAGIPALLETACQLGYHQQFLQEFEPVGPTENALVTELARQAAALDRWGEAALAVERQAARGLKELAATTGIDAVAFDDALLAASLSTENADRCERHSLARSRAFQRVLQKIEELQARRKIRDKPSELEPSRPFADEGSCERYLLDRFQKRKIHCPKCGAAEGYSIASRHCWECGQCRAHIGLRVGTVMARSPLSLWSWFEAIRWLLSRPTIDVAELAQKIGIRRLATVRAMARRIRETMADDDASARLAGLDEYFLSRLQSS